MQTPPCKRLIGLFIGTLQAALVLGLVPPAMAGAVEVGTESDITWGDSREEIDRVLALTREAGIKRVRANISWKGVEPNGKGQISPWIETLDYAVDKARANGLEVLVPIVGGAPYWASGDPDKYTDSLGVEHWNPEYKPRSNAEFADFAAYIVNHYKGRVSSYQVWNEPNHPRFWPSGSNAAEYVALLKEAYPAIKSADPSATVAMAGLSGNDYDYLEQMYRAGAKSYFDVAAIHPYSGSVDPTWCWTQEGTTRNAKDAFCGIEEIRKSMVAYGDSAKKLWLTEMGWSVGNGPYQVTEAKQAEYLTKAFDRLRSYRYVTRASWYGFRNVAWLYDDPSEFEGGFGLLRTDFSPKPALSAMKAVAALSVPSITRPADRSYDRDGSFSVGGTATPNNTISLYEGTTRKGSVRAAGDGQWSIPLTSVPNGVHTYTARATNPAGNRSSASAPRTVIVDTLRPSVTAVSPAPAATGVSRYGNVYATFSERMRAATITTTTVRLVRQGATTPVAATLSYDSSLRRAKLDPTYRLARGTLYTARVTTSARDLAGNPLTATKTWSFRTSR